MQRKSNAEPTGVVLRRGSGLPVYLQVVDQFRYLIAAGRFRLGDYLPPMRQVAEELGLNLNTVLRAYAELQRDGLIESTRGKGAVVVRTESDSASAVRRAAGEAPSSIDAMLSAAVDHALSAGLDAAEILARTQAALDSAGERAPAGPRLSLLASPAWRARELADTLRATGAGRVRPETDPEAAAGSDLVIRPMFGAFDYGSDPVGAPTLNVALLPDRSFLREILDIGPGSKIAVVAVDERAATWIADAVTGYSEIVPVLRIVADSFPEAELPEVNVIAVERGMPRVPAVSDSVKIVLAGAAFPPSITDSISARLR